MELNIVFMMKTGYKMQYGNFVSTNMRLRTKDNLHMGFKGDEHLSQILTANNTCL